MKRALLALLILANLGVFAWVHWYVNPSHADLAPVAAPGGAPLKLMSELTPAERKNLASAPVPAPATAPVLAAATHAAPAAVTATVAAGALVCASYGPFPSADAASQALARLKTAGIVGNPHAIAGKAKLGYWVYLPPFGSRKEADAAAAMLKKRGVTDIYVVADEANRNAVSLGVFSQRDGAVQREKEIKKLGFKAQMAERFRDEPRYWLDAKGADSAMPPADVFKDLQDEASPVGRVTSACAG
jgi:hypothetical protein